MSSVNCVAGRIKSVAMYLTVTGACTSACIPLLEAWGVVDFLKNKIPISRGFSAALVPLSPPFSST